MWHLQNTLLCPNPVLKPRNTPFTWKWDCQKTITKWNQPVKFCLTKGLKVSMRFVNCCLNSVLTIVFTFILMQTDMYGRWSFVFHLIQGTPQTHSLQWLTSVERQRWKSPFFLCWVQKGKHRTAWAFFNISSFLLRFMSWGSQQTQGWFDSSFRSTEIFCPVHTAALASSYRGTT